MVHKKEIQNSTNVKHIMFNDEVNQMVVEYIPKKPKKGFDNIEALNEALGNIYLDGKISYKEALKKFKEEYGYPFEKEANRINGINNRYLYDNVTLDIYNEIASADSVGGKLRELVTSKPESFPSVTIE